MSNLKQQMANMYPTKENFKVKATDMCRPVNKAKTAVIAGILFLIISAPLYYKMLDGILSKMGNLRACDEHGCPTPVGLAIATVLFVILMRVLA